MGKIKQFIESDKGKDILTVIIVILVGSGSFELGRLSKDSSSGIKIEYPNQNNDQKVSTAPLFNPVAKTATATSTTQNSTQNIFFASSRGSKYYPANCSAGKTIKQENRIYFATREEAEKAGYALSSSCQ